MSFRILNSKNEPIKINDLDKEAAMLWNKEVKKKYYATPLHTEDLSFPESFRMESINTNWFDKIGWAIHYYKLETWKEIRDNILQPFEELPIEETLLYEPIKAYLSLIELWESKGYKPQFVNE
jgi:hypothetical protein